MFHPKSSRRPCFLLQKIRQRKYRILEFLYRVSLARNIVEDVSRLQCKKIRKFAFWHSIKNSNAHLGLVSHFIAAFTNSIIADIPVLKRISSVSSVTRFIAKCSTRSWASVGSTSVTGTPSAPVMAIFRN